MKLAEVLRAKSSLIATIHPDQLVATAVRDLKVHAVGALVVTRDQHHVDGIVSERDVVRALADDDAVMRRRVGDIMSTRFETCSPDDGVTHAMELVTHRRQRHVPVVDGDRLVGVVSVGDLVKVRLQELELESQILRESSTARLNR
jgi:CBS domain-containing protein